VKSPEFSSGDQELCPIGAPRLRAHPNSPDLQMLQCAAGIGPCLAPTNPSTDETIFCSDLTLLFGASSYFPFLQKPSNLTTSTTSFRSYTPSPNYLLLPPSCQRYLTSASSPLPKTLIAPHLIYALPKIVRSENTTIIFHVAEGS
jgi:hypothetical protein